MSISELEARVEKLESTVALLSRVAVDPQPADLQSLRDLGSASQETVGLRMSDLRL